MRLLIVANLLLAAWYFSWLLTPTRMGNPVLFGLLVVAELFNLCQAAGFWWTIWGDWSRPLRTMTQVDVAVDLYIPTYNEPIAVVEPVVAAAARVRGADVRVALLDDGDRPEMQALASYYGVDYITRADRSGAKAGNINHALTRTSAPFVAIFDCDHVPSREFLQRTLPEFDEDVALVQTPQYYANCGDGYLQRAVWAQQALFFGAIARGKDAVGAIFCCGTNVVFRRAALTAVGGFPIHSVTEDFQLSVRLHESGWRTVYVPEVLAHGLGPEDMASYVSQQMRWARGCLSAIPSVVRARLRFKLRLHYLLSASFFLSGWTALIYMLLPIIRILTGLQPLSDATADQFLIHFIPYFITALLTVAVAGGGSYVYGAFALMFACFWVHVTASVLVLARRPGRFVVTPKSAQHGRQLRPIAPALVMLCCLLAAALTGILRGVSPAVLNNVGFALLHAVVLLSGTWAALRGDRRPALDEATAPSRSIALEEGQPT